MDNLMKTFPHGKTKPKVKTIAINMPMCPNWSSVCHRLTNFLSSIPNYTNPPL